MDLINFILHIDQHLFEFARNYGTWLYLLLFAVVFVETGVVVAPLLPGDSLLFAAGMLGATGVLNPWLTTGLLIIAAVAGDNLNAALGRRIGQKLLARPGRLIKMDHLHQAEKFFNKYGALAIIGARFLPFVRTFVPFVAGVSQMPAGRYFLYSVIGAVLWVNIFVWMGFLLGQVPFFRDHISAIGVAILGFSVLPMLVGVIRHKLGGKRNRQLARAEESQLAERIDPPR